MAVFHASVKLPTMKRYQIWHYTSVDPQGVGGVERHVAEISSALSRLGHRVYIGSSSPPDIDDASIAGTILHTHGDLWADKRLLSHFLGKKPGNFKWIHVCHGSTFERMLSCGEYFSISGWKGMLRDLSVLKPSDAVVCVSHHAAKEIRKYHFVTAPLTVIHNGVDTNLYKPLERLATKPAALFLGRTHDRVKNFDNLISAGAALFSRKNDFELHVAPGCNSTHPWVKDLGKLSPPKAFAAMKECRALVLPSRYEGDPLVLREAMAVGLPVIASDIPGVAETLGNYENTTLVEPENTHSIETALEHVLYNSPNLVPTPSSRSWDDAAAEFISLYARVLG